MEKSKETERRIDEKFIRLFCIIRRTKYLFVICFVLVFFNSCKKDDSNPVGADPIVDKVIFNPSTVQKYSWSVKVIDSSGRQTLSESDTLALSIVSTSDTLPRFGNLTRMELSSLKKDSPGKSIAWYRQDKDSLIEIAYVGAGTNPLLLPKHQEHVPFSPASLIPRSVKKYLEEKNILADSILFRDDIRIVYKYPFIAGSSWISFRSPFLQMREVTGKEFVTVKAGTFFCAKIKTTLYWSGVADQNLEWYDYVSTGGLALRTIQAKFTIGNETGPEGKGWAISYERSELLP